MIGRTSVKAAGWDVPGRREGQGCLGHWRALDGSAGGSGGSGWVGSGGGAVGVLMEAGLRLREGQFGQSVGGRGGDGQRGGRDGERGRGQVTL